MTFVESLATGKPLSKARVKRGSLVNRVETERFHYCLDLESALTQLCGISAERSFSAGLFHDPAQVKRALRTAIKKIRSRLNQITTVDERLRLTTSIALERLEDETRKLSRTSDNELEIIAHLIELIALLLGFDWEMGKPNREVVYFQTFEQQRIDDIKRHPDGPNLTGIFRLKKQRELICGMYQEGLRVAQISDVMTLSESMVKDTLVRAGLLPRETQTKQT